MFTITRPNLFVSSDGFSVEVLGRTGLRYTEAGRSTEIDSEILTDNPAITIRTASLRTWDDGATIDGTDRNRIICNVREAFHFQGFDIAVDGVDSAYQGR